jgi:hypothetical protein
MNGTDRLADDTCAGIPARFFPAAIQKGTSFSGLFSL